jgi:hypothetical protein
MTKLHIENINITISSAKPSMPPLGLLAALASIGDDKPCKRPADLPTIGDKWPGTEAIYAGKALSRDGSKIVDLVYWPDAGNTERNYADNISYCESVDANTGSHAATRQQAIVLNDNLRHLMQKGSYYWTETKDNDGDAAFVQYFFSGNQYYDYLGIKNRALAVSEIH